jgi:hypothetical protein
MFPKKYYLEKMKDLNSIKNSMNYSSKFGKRINNNYVNNIMNESNINEPEPNNLLYNINKIRNKGVYIINNVYQSYYNNNQVKCAGLGDFIRGCYFILEFCDKYNFKSRIIFNNPISNFLNIKTFKLEFIKDTLNSIDFFQKNNVKNFTIQNEIIFEPEKETQNITSEFVEHISNTPNYNENIFICCNSFPNGSISEKNIAYMKKILEPTIEIKTAIHDILNQLNLKYKKYSVIHIRSGDNYLKNETNTFDKKYIDKLTNIIENDTKLNQYMSNSVMNDIQNKEYLIICDNNPIKVILLEKFPTFKILLKDITHFGEGVILQEEKVKNTLIDFYLLSFANKILAYSCYEHGSGFSYWCAKTYGVPYTCKLVK